MDNFPVTNNRVFSSPTVPGFSVSVNRDEAFIVVHNSNTFSDEMSQSYTQTEIRELIGVLLDVHEEMEEEDQETEEDQMGLFDNIEETTDEVIIPETEEVTSDADFSELVGNCTTFLMMNEDMENERISKEEMFDALHILRDSINSYLEDAKENGQEEINEFEEIAETE